MHLIEELASHVSLTGNGTGMIGLDFHVTHDVVFICQRSKAFSLDVPDTDKVLLTLYLQVSLVANNKFVIRLLCALSDISVTANTFLN